MIARINPLVMASVVALAVLSMALPLPTRGRTAAAPMAGVIYSSAETKPVSNKATAIAAINVGVDAAARGLLPVGPEVLVRLVAVDASSFTVTLAGRWLELSRASLAAAAVAAKRRRTPPPPSPAPPAPPSPPAVVITAPAVPAPVLPTTFNEIDEGLRESSTTQAINVRLKKGGVSFRLTHVGRVGDRYVIRYAIANEESADFFLSIVNAAAGGKPIHSETAGPYSCPAGQEVFGAVHFAVVDAAGKSVAVELIQSGGDRRRFPMGLSYSF